MDSRRVISEYFEKATALVLSSAGIDSIEKQALHLIAAEAERYAYSLGTHATKLAEASRRSQCTANDIEAAAMCLNPQGRHSDYPKISINSEAKMKLRLSVENKGLGEDGKVEIRFPQFSEESIESLIAEEDGGVRSPLKGIGKRLHCYPEWLQRELESKQGLVGRVDEKSKAMKSQQPLLNFSGESGPLSMISSLVLAEEESREILTKKLKIGVSETPQNGNDRARANS